MTQEVLRQMYQLLLTEPHAPTVCAQLERIAREALAEHAMQEVQRLGQEIEQEPVEVDQATMELAESVGLIGPTSRTHDLHQAIQRFHDLICVEATVKAAQMAADVIRECNPSQRTEEKNT